MVIVTPGASVSFFRPEFNDFLYAPIVAEKSEMPLSVLSALSRLDVDPWQEAAELSELPTDTATQRLVSLLARLPAGPWAQADSWAIADRLIELLPRGSPKGQVAETGRGLHAMTGSTLAKMLICAALGVTALIIMAASREPSSRTDQADVPAYYGAATPPQTLPPSSR